MKKGIDPLFWWGLGTCGVIVISLVGFAVVTSPRPTTEAQERDRQFYWPSWVIWVPGVGAGAGAAAQASRQKWQAKLTGASTATADDWPPEVEQAIKKVTSYTHDRKVAERLMMACSRANPEKSIHWVVEKVVQDIVRDRR